MSLDRREQDDELADVGLLEPTVGPFDPFGRNLCSKRDGSMRDRRDHGRGRAAQPGQSLERHRRIGEELAGTPEVRIVDEVVWSRVGRVESLGDRARSCSHRRLDIIDTSLWTRPAVPSPSRHRFYKLLCPPRNFTGQEGAGANYVRLLSDRERLV